GRVRRERAGLVPRLQPSPASQPHAAAVGPRDHRSGQAQGGGAVLPAAGRAGDRVPLRHASRRTQDHSDRPGRRGPLRLRILAGIRAPGRQSHDGTVHVSQQVFVIEGPTVLRGEVTVRGAKNSVLKLMAATLLAPGASTISNVPDIADVRIMCELLSRLGCDIDYDAVAGTVRIDVPTTPGTTADYELVRLMRASI